MTYTDISNKEAEEFLIIAGKSSLRSIEKLAGGWANSNYLLSINDGTQLVLKIWNERTPKEVEKIVSLTCWLAEHNIPTPTPLTLGNSNKTIIKNGLTWMLLPYIDADWLGYDYDSLFSLGRTQAMLHAVEPPEGIMKDFSMGFKFFHQLFEVANNKDNWSPFLLQLKEEATLLSELIPTDLPKGIIHGDLFPDNVLGRDGEVIAILDFEESCKNYLALDIAMTFVGFGWSDGEPITERWQAIIAGYESIRKLNESERNALPHLHRYATLSIAAWRYWQFVMNIPNTEYSDRYVEMISRLDKNLPF